MAEKRKTFCRVCHAACPIVVEVEDDRRVVAVSGDRSDPLFEGYTCIKGRQLADQHHHPDRIRSSLRRTEQGFEPVPSAAALDEIAVFQIEIRSTGQCGSISGMNAHWCPGFLFYRFQCTNVINVAMGYKNVFYCEAPGCPENRICLCRRINDDCFSRCRRH